MAPPASAPKAKGGETLNRNEKSADIRHRNIVAAIGVADSVRTSLGPKGMDKMIQDGKGGTIITNDGATILKQMSVVHPTAKMLVELSKAQDIEAGDGTTSVVVLAGSLLNVCQTLLDKGIHPQVISEAFLASAAKAKEILKGMAKKVDLADRDSLIDNAATSLSSKVVAQSSDMLAPLAVDAVMKVYDPARPGEVDLNDIRVVKKGGATVEDTELVDGLVFVNQRVAKGASGPTRVENAKVGLIQFCLSPPKTNLENNIEIRDYQAMDRLLREERQLMIKMVKQIQKTGCNVLLVQKSILRDALSDLALDLLAKAKIMVIKDIERDDIEFISRALLCEPVSSLELFSAEKLGSCGVVREEEAGGGGRIVRVEGVKGKRAVTVLCRASNNLILDETERSLHDALCVVRSLVKLQYVIQGAGVPEMELSCQLSKWGRSLPGVESICARAFAEALEVVPYTLAENAGLDPLQIVTELRARHEGGHMYDGINVKKGKISDMSKENVVQPLLVTQSAIQLATETVMMIMKIDDIVITR